MKTLFFCLQLFLVSNIYCQTAVFQPGATWIGHYDNRCGTGYEVLEYVGDTIVHGHLLNAVKHTGFYYSYQISRYMEADLRTSYYFKEDNKLYYVTDNRFFKSDTLKNSKMLIFDYNVEEGDSIKHLVRQDKRNNKSHSIRFTVIDSIGIEKENEMPNKTWYGNYYDFISSRTGKSTEVVFNERMGELTLFHFTNVQKASNEKRGDLLYYWDESGFEYDPLDSYESIQQIIENCRATEPAHKNNHSLNVPKKTFIEKLFPNPCSDVINIQFDESVKLEFLSYEIHRAACNSLLLSGKIKNFTETIDVSSVSNGNYVCIIKENGRLISTHSFVVVK